MAMLGPFTYTKSAGSSANSDLEKIYSDLVSNMGSVYKDSVFIKLELLAYAKAILDQKLRAKEDYDNRFIPQSYTYILPTESEKFNLSFLKSDKEKRDFLVFLYTSTTQALSFDRIHKYLQVLAPTIYNSISVNTAAEQTFGTNFLLSNGKPQHNQSYAGQPTYTLGLGGTDGIVSRTDDFATLMAFSFSVLYDNPQTGDFIETYDSVNPGNNSGRFLIQETDGYLYVKFFNPNAINSTTVSYSFKHKYQLWSSSELTIRILLSSTIPTNSQVWSYELQKMNVFLQQTLPAQIDWSFYSTQPFYLGADDGSAPFASRLDGYSGLSLS